MSVEIQFVFVLLAVICFTVAAFVRALPAWPSLVALGLALVTFPTLWNLGEAL